ncbi:MAG: hypothetical protein ABJC24_05975 [Chloroflexota bacterium]
MRRYRARRRAFDRALDGVAGGGAGAVVAGDPDWYRFVADALFTAGALRSPQELLEAFLGGPLTAEPLLADLAGPRLRS